MNCITFCVIFVLLVVKISKNPTEGLKCYVCEHFEGDESTIKCLNPDDSLLKECPEPTDEATIMSCVNGTTKYIGLTVTTRNCLPPDAGKKETGCMTWAEAHKGIKEPFNDEPDGGGQVCICNDKDSCNGA